jgi:triosephosphate isomerase (TIM)
MTNKKLIVGNWKMNPATLDEAKRIARKTKRVATQLKYTEAIICPPFAFISACASRKKISGFGLGAQNVSYEEDGAHTGEVGAVMLKNIGVQYVIVGHSEERARGDSDSIVAKKIKTLLDFGLTPIVCVGETVRNEDGSHFEFIKVQIKNSFVDVPKKYADKIILAYEPVWAIGAKEPMSPENIYEMSLFVKKTFADVFGQKPAMKMTILYGGSVNCRNAVDIISIGKIDGLLVGRESVNIVGFVELLKAVDGIYSGRPSDC